MITFKEELDTNTIKYHLLNLIDRDKENGDNNYYHINEFELEVLLSIEDHREMIYKLYNKINRKYKYYSKEQLVYIIEEVSKCFGKVEDTNYFTFLFYLVVGKVGLYPLETKYNKYKLDKHSKNTYSIVGFDLFNIYLHYNNNKFSYRDINIHNVISIQEKEEDYYRGLKDMFNFMVNNDTNLMKQLEIDLTKYIKDNFYYKSNKDNIMIIDNKNYKNMKDIIIFDKLELY